jgi:thiol-disulfide isomerase/thioredoxin
VGGHNQKFSGRRGLGCVSLLAILAWAIQLYYVTPTGGAQMTFLGPLLLQQVKPVGRASSCQQRRFSRTALSVSDMQAAISEDLTNNLQIDGLPQQASEKQQVSEEDLTRLRLARHAVMTAVIQEEDLESLLEAAATNKQLVVVDYYAPWCRVCRRLLKQLEVISKDAAYSNVLFASADYTQARDLCQSHDVQKLPTIEIYQGDQLKQKWSGGNKKRLLERLDREMQEMHDAEEAMTA